MIQAALIALIAFLAYMGDAVMSLLVREKLLAQGWQKSKILQKKSESWVSAKAQAYFLIQLKERAFFSEEEYAIVLRGRNTHSASKAKNADVTTYRMSTGLEALFGWLYLTHQKERLQALWEEIQKIGEYQ